MDYFSLVDVENKTIYDLGKASEAKYYLPYFAYKYKNKPIVLFGDESHGWLEEKFQTTEYGGEYYEENFGDLNIDNSILENINMSKQDFYSIFDKIGGEEITNLSDFIKIKYNPKKIEV